MANVGVHDPDLGSMTVALTDLISEGVLIIGSHTLTVYGIAGTAGEGIIDGTALSSVGLAATIDRVTFSEGPLGLLMVSGGRTTTLTSVGVDAPSVTSTDSATQSSTPSAGGAATAPDPPGPSKTGAAAAFDIPVRVMVLAVACALMCWM